MASIFISHSSRDKGFARRLATALVEHGHIPWLDEWEIKVGGSITTRIEQGLASAEYLAIVLPQHSVASKWVEREWRAKYWDEIGREHVAILPLMVEKCELPVLLRDKKYADFRDEFNQGLVELLAALDPNASISPAALNVGEHFAQLIAELLTRAHSDEPLSAVCVATMQYAHSRILQQLYNFCQGEIQGYHGHGMSEEKFSQSRPYRVIEFVASNSGPINPDFFGFGTPTGLFNFIKRNPDRFVPVQVMDRDGIGEIEHSSNQPKGIRPRPTHSHVCRSRQLFTTSPLDSKQTHPIACSLPPENVKNSSKSPRPLCLVER